MPGEAHERLILAFLQRYHRDEERGEVRPLADYLALFPDAQDAIAREYLRLEASIDEDPPTEADRDGPGRGLVSARTVGRFALHRLLGSGGQGQVWLARDPQLDRDIALKILHGSGPGTEKRIQRFRREATVAARLNHPAICPVLSAGLEDGIPYIAMPFIAGRSLSACIAARAAGDSESSWASLGASVDEERDDEEHVATETEPKSRSAEESSVTRSEIAAILTIGRTIARALQVAHESGVVHRDIKPANILVRPGGDPVILDFGLARSVEGNEPTLTQSGDVCGTPSYMSPEQVEASRSVDHRTDIYSLAATLFECVTLRPPFVAATRERLYRAILTEPLPRLQNLNDAISRDLGIVLATALDKDPDRRYATVHDFAEDLDRVVKFKPILARPTSWPVKLGLWARRHTGVAVSVSAAILSLSAGLIFSLVFLGQSQRNEDVALARGRELSDQKRLALDRLEAYEQLADSAVVRRLLLEAESFWPRRPELVPRMDVWLEEARSLTTRQEIHGRNRDALRAEAIPYTEAASLADDGARRDLHGRLFARYDKVISNLRATRLSKSSSVAALARIEPQLERASEARADLLNRQQERLEDEIEDADGFIGELNTMLVGIESDPRFRDWIRLGSPDPKVEWLHGVLNDLYWNLEDLKAAIEDISSRREFATTLADRTIESHREIWDVCIADVATNPRYAATDRGDRNGAPLREMKPQNGLVPLGRDDRSGLWEFWIPETGPCPRWVESGPNVGRVSFDGVTWEEFFGMVLVLLPGGRFAMGSEKPAEFGEELASIFCEWPRHEVELAPFFMSKYELTQGQWRAHWKADPSLYKAGGLIRGIDERVTNRDPVTNIDWFDATRHANRFGLLLPTEAQWEYAARGGTTTSFWCGESVDSVMRLGAANVGNPGVEFQGAAISATADGYPLHAPSGTFAPNPFGLHDLIGNVYEWCRERHGRYDSELRPGDGLRTPGTELVRIVRGGSFRTHPAEGRSAKRNGSSPSTAKPDLGVRLIREVE